MRLREKEVNIIKETVADIFGKDSTIYLFGSRVNDNKKGGDVDLFIISKNNSFENKIKTLVELKRFLHKPVDIVLHKDFKRDIEQEALKGVKIK